MVRNKRKPYIISSISSLSGGVIFAVLGGVFLRLGIDSYAEVNKYRDLWLEATDPQTAEEYRVKGIEAQEKRDLQHGLGIAFMSLSGVAIASGAVLFYIMPAIPDAPTLFQKKESKQTAEARNAPSWACDFGGINVVGRF